ncbi:HipA N-terminal domain-containing protein [Collinsella aerofaciens]|uniref:HipA N-terminal domain-containing protein n=1 Tax=Collinsella aerofaciens TaxID=74426 RepID=UPI0034A2BDB8
MARTSLRTFICGVPAGTLTQDENGLISFTYDHDYDGPALSTNIPVSNRTYGQQVMNPYLFGLLPDSEDQRKAIAAEFDVRPNNPVALVVSRKLV